MAESSVLRVEWLEPVAQGLRDADVFEAVVVEAGRVIATARDVDGAASYEVAGEGDAATAGLYTPDRWLSGSIEADLVHTGDKMEDLLEEELIEQGVEHRLEIRHFRNDAKQFVFESNVTRGELDDGQWVDRLVRVLLAYEACFRELGDFAASDEDELFDV